jgi:two-component system response regulator
MSRALKIVVVDDDTDDMQLMQHAANEAKLTNPMVYLEGGVQLFDLLKGPDLDSIGIIMLDLNMPGMDGREIIRLMKLHNEWKKIPVIIFSTSDSKDDVKLTYSSGAASYIKKPLSFSKLVSILQAIKVYWFENALLPNQP